MDVQESTNYTYDMYGNATNVATTVTDNDLGSPQWTSTTVTTVTPDSGANWCLNQPINVAVTKSATGVPAITRTVGFTIDYGKCRATHKTVEPSSSLYALTEAYGFDDFGNVNLTTTTGIGVTARATGVNWGVMGLFPMTITNALNETAQRGYDFNLGVLTSTTDANGIQLSSQYDTFGRKIRESRADGTYTVLTYNDCANTGGCLIGSHALAITSTVYNSDNSVFTDGTTYFDPYDRALIDSKRLFAGGYDRNEVRYDNLGRVAQRFMPCTWASVMVACETWTTYTYDLLGRLTSESRPINANNSAPQTTTIDYQGRTTIFTDPQGKRSTRVATVTGDMGKSQDHNGYYQNFGYDAFGSLTSVTDSQSNSLFSASYEYGVDAFQTGTTDMDLGSRGFAYNALGETTAYTDANGASFGMTYDPLSRLKTRTVAGEGTTTFVMGDSAANFNIGQLLSVSSTGGPTETYTYDSKGRLSRKQIVSDATYNYDYTYNSLNGLPDTVAYPVSTSNYRLTLRYDYQNGFMYQVKDANASTVFWQANTINVRGQTTQDTLGNGLVTNRSFDAVTGWINSIQCGAAGGACAQNQSYLFDFVGNLIQRQNNNLGLTENFYYDDLYRLHDSQLNGATNLTMSYDAMGNITSKSDVAGGAAWTYSASRKHQVTQAGNSSYTYSYDSNGNAITRNGYGITWNKYNYPTLINGNGESTALSYDGNHARWKQVYTKGQTTETTIYAGDQLEKVSVGGVDDYRHYIDANGQTVAIMSRTTLGANNTRYVLSDAQGGVTKITDSSGASVVSESFTAFGARRNPATWSGSPTNGDQVASDAITRQGYTGHDALGSLGLIHMNGRVQDAITGRFLSADPYITEPDNTQNYNRYSYVHNNPMTFTDPSGFGAFRNCFESSEADRPLMELIFTGDRWEWITSGHRYVTVCIPELPSITITVPIYPVVSVATLDEVVVTAQKPNCDAAANTEEGRRLTFLRTQHPPASAVANAYGVDVELLLTLSAKESGYGGAVTPNYKYTNSNNPFGFTPGGAGTRGTRFSSYDSAWQAWGRQWGPRVQGVGSDINKFSSNLLIDNRNRPGAVDRRGSYNSINLSYAAELRHTLPGVQRRLKCVKPN